MNNAGALGECAVDVERYIVADSEVEVFFRIFGRCCTDDGGEVFQGCIRNVENLARMLSECFWDVGKILQELWGKLFGT